MFVLAQLGANLVLSMNKAQHVFLGVWNVRMLHVRRAALLTWT